MNFTTFSIQKWPLRKVLQYSVGSLEELQMTKSIKINLVFYAIKLALHYTLVIFLQWIFCKVFAIFYKNCLPWPDEKDLLQNFLGGKLLQLIAQ